MLLLHWLHNNFISCRRPAIFIEPIQIAILKVVNVDFIIAHGQSVWRLLFVVVVARVWLLLFWWLLWWGWWWWWQRLLFMSDIHLTFYSLSEVMQFKQCSRYSSLIIDRSTSIAHNTSWWAIAMMRMMIVIVMLTMIAISSCEQSELHSRAKYRSCCNMNFEVSNGDQTWACTVRDWNGASSNANREALSQLASLPNRWIAIYGVINYFHWTYPIYGWYRFQSCQQQC